MEIDPKSHVKELMLKKEHIENEIKHFHDVLQSVKCLLQSTVDKSFPFSSIFMGMFFSFIPRRNFDLKMI